VTVKDHILQQNLEIRADLVALSAGMVAEDTKEMSGIMKLNRNPEGYFIEAHVKLRPVDMPSEGVFLCGTAHGPKLITETISQAQAAASRATTFLAKDAIKLSRRFLPKMPSSFRQLRPRSIRIIVSNA